MNAEGDRTPSQNRMFQLFSAEADGWLEADERQELLELLRRDPQARAAYAEQAILHSLLFYKARCGEGRGAGDEGRGMDGLPASGGEAGFGVRDSGFGIQSSGSLSVGAAVEPPSGQWPRTPNPEPPVFPFPSLFPFPSPLSPDFVGSWTFACMVSAVFVCVMLLVLWAIKITPHQHIAEAPSQSVPSYVRPEMVFVGRITGMVDVKWLDDPRFLPPLSSRAYVPLGRKYILDSGLMEITYDTGTKVILQGPCTYEVESTASGYLSLGKLTARVGAGGGGRGTGKSGSNQKSEIRNQKSPSSFILHPSSLFFVRTPTAVVTDLGTEFGVEVSEEGHTISRVFRGSVKVQVVGDGPRQEVVLSENESARVEKSEGIGGPRLVLVGMRDNPPKFVRRLIRPPRVLDLLDVVAGGHGMGWCRERGIDPSTGMEDPLFVLRGGLINGRSDGRYRPVAFRGGLIDGVFTPDGRAGAVQIDSAGHAFDGFPPTDGRFYGSIWARAADVSPVSLNQQYVPWVYLIGRCEQFTPQGRGLLCLHANGGITFDLEAVRKMYPGERPAWFRAVAGLGNDPRPKGVEGGTADVWVFVDGRLKFQRAGLRFQDGPVEVNVALGPADHFLTLVSTDGGNEYHWDRVVFGDPRLLMLSTESENSAGDGTEQVEHGSPNTPQNRKEDAAMNGP